MSEYSHYTYCLQGDSPHFGPWVSIPKCPTNPIIHIAYKKIDTLWPKGVNTF